MVSTPSVSQTNLFSFLFNSKFLLKSDDAECFINTISPKWKHMLLRSLYHQILQILNTILFHLWITELAALTHLFLHIKGYCSTV